MAGYCLDNRRGDLTAILLLAALALAFWGNCLFGGKVPVAAVYQKQMLPWAAVAPAGGETRQWDSLLWDSMAQFYPWRLLLHRAAQSDQLPLWNPYQFCGYPFVGNGQSAMFYPLNWLYFLVHPKIGLGLSAALHFFLGGLFVFGLARSWKLSVMPSLFAALAFTYGGFMVTWIELPTLPNSLIWLPLAWWGIETLTPRPPLPMRRLASPGEGESALPGPLEGPAISRPAVRGFLMLSTALGMSLLAGHFQIAAYVWIFAGLYAIVRLIVAGGARRTEVAARPQRDTRRLNTVGVLTLAAFLGLMLAMAQLLPTLELGKYSARGAGGPSAAGFEFHRQRALQPLELLTLLTPDFLGSPVTNDYPGISYSEHCGFVGAITLLLGLLGLFLKPRRGMAWLFGGIALFALWGAMAGPPAMLLYWCVPKLSQAGGFARLLSVWTLAAAMWGGVGLQAVVDSMKRAPSATNGGPANGRPLRTARAPGAVVLVALALLLVQVLPWAYRFNPRAKAEEVYPETELIRQLRQIVGQDRYLAPVSSLQDWALDSTPNVVMPPNAATVYGLRSADGYDSLFPATYRQFAAQTEGQDPSPPANGNMILTQMPWYWSNEAVVTGVFRTAYLEFPMGLEVYQGEGCTILHWCGQPRPLPWGRAHLSLAKAGGKRSRYVVPLTVDDLNRVRVTLPERLPDASAELQVVDTIYPGWQPYVDGKASDLRAYESVFRQVQVSSGDRQVEMIYFPASVACGLFVSLVALAALVAIGTTGLRGCRR